MNKTYLVSVQIPEGEDEYNYTVSVAHILLEKGEITYGEGVAGFTAPAVPVAALIGPAIMEDAQK